LNPPIKLMRFISLVLTLLQVFANQQGKSLWVRCLLSGWRCFFKGQMFISHQSFFPSKTQATIRQRIVDIHDTPGD